MSASRLEYIVCTILILLSVAAWATIDLAESTASGFLLRQERSMGGVDYQTLPKISAVALALLSVLNIILCVRKNQKRASPSRQTHQEPATSTVQSAEAVSPQCVAWRTWLTGFILLGYVFLLPLVSFFLLTAVFMFALFQLYGLKNIGKNALVACLGAMAFWMLFIKIANLSI